MLLVVKLRTCGTSDEWTIHEPQNSPHWDLGSYLGFFCQLVVMDWECILDITNHIGFIVYINEFMFHQKYSMAPHYIFSVRYCTVIGHMIASIPCFQWADVCRSIARAILKIVLMALFATQFWWGAFVPQTKFVHCSHGINKSA